MEQVCEPGGVAYPFFDFKVKNDRLPIDDKDYFKDASGSATMTRIAIGCKTGTAQVGGADTASHAWITVFAPFYNPEVVVTVLVENSGEGSDVAAPIAKSILTDYFQNKK
jgi:cell division protein FtsI/penicillin-binding protein 2